MKVLIMADMEGVSGIVTWDQVTAGKAFYEEGRKLYTEELNAAVRGAKKAGVTEIVLVDCHGAGGNYSFNSLLPELIDPDCTWVAHHPWSRYSSLFYGFLGHSWVCFMQGEPAKDELLHPLSRC